MIWLIIMIIFNLSIGMVIGAVMMRYKDRNILRSQKILSNELQNNKVKLSEYQKRLSNHFTDNLELLNKIAENYRNLYQNMKKNASFFLPKTYTADDVDSFHIKNKCDNNNDEHFPVEAPRDYSDHVEVFQKDNKHTQNT